MKRLLPLTLALILALSACAPTGVETPAPSETATPTATPSPAPQVYTDYSQLTPHEKPEQPIAKFTRRYGEFTDTLIPSDDYGFLIPFPGAVLNRLDDDPYWGWGGDDYLYGLMTLEGEVVVDPVFSSAYVLTYWDKVKQESKDLDCLVLQKVVKDKNGEPMTVHAFCARDGSWCTGFDYTYDHESFMERSEENILPVRRVADGPDTHNLVYLDARTGEELTTVNLDRFLAQFPNAGYEIHYGDRCLLLSENTKRYLYNFATEDILALEDTLGTVITNSGSFSEGLCMVKTSSGWGYIDGSGQWAIQPRYDDAYGFQNGMALVRGRDSGSPYQYIDPTGKALYTFPDGAELISSEGNYISYTLDGQSYFLDRDWNSVSASLPEDFTNAIIEEGDWFYQDIPDPDSPELGSCAFWNPGTGTRLDFSGLRQQTYAITDDYTLLSTPADLTRDEDGYLVCYDDYYTLLRLSTGETTELGRWGAVHFQRDGRTGELFLYLMGPDSDKNHYEVRTLDGETLYRTDNPGFWYTGLFDRKALDAKENVVILTDLNTGELLFSWPLHPAED